jgi:hypothetical protein
MRPESCDKKEKDKITSWLGIITNIHPAGPNYVIDFKLPEVQAGRLKQAQDSINISSHSLGSIINAITDAYGNQAISRPMNTELIGQEMIVFYEHKTGMKFIKPYVLYQKPKVH